MILNPLQSAAYAINNTLPFYRDNMYDDTFLRLLYTTVGEVVNMLAESAVRADASKSVATSLFYNKVPYASLVVSTNDALYDEYQLSRDLQSSGTNWSSLTLREKIDILDSRGKFATLSVGKYWESKNAKATSLEIWPLIDCPVDTPYTQNIDYAVRFNKLYLFGELARPSYADNVINNTTTIINNKTLVLKNIFYENKDIVEKWGKMLGINKLPSQRNEVFKGVLTNVLNILQNGPTIANIRQLNTILDWAGTGVYDIISSHDSATGEDYSWWWSSQTLTPFHFIIKVPGDLARSSEQIGFLQTVVNILKPSYAQYRLIIPTTAKDIILFSEPTSSGKTLAGSERVVTNDSSNNAMTLSHASDSMKQDIYYDMACAVYDIYTGQGGDGTWGYDETYTGGGWKPANALGDLARTTYTLTSGTPGDYTPVIA